MKRSIILSRLLDKYENSKHLFEPGVSTRRVMLRIEKKELPEYDYQKASVRDAFNQAAQELEREYLVTLEWVTDRPFFLRLFSIWIVWMRVILLWEESIQRNKRSL